MTARACPLKSSPCPVHDHVVERAVDDGAGKSGARLRLDAALVAAEDGHVSSARFQHVVQHGRELQERRRGGPAVL